VAVKLCRSAGRSIVHLRYPPADAELIIGHNEWAEQVLAGFSWGHAFFEVNGLLLERYAACEDAEGVGNVQEEWLARLEREWKERRETKEGEDEWAGGNPNLRAVEGDDDDDEEEYADEGEEEVKMKKDSEEEGTHE
jgi:rRNA small subunit aminocarboxypropyltransferase